MDQDEADSLFKTDVQKVFEIVSEATQTDIPIKSERSLVNRFEKLGASTIMHATFGFVTMLVIAVIAYYLRLDPLIDTLISVGILTLLCVLTNSVLTILPAIPLIITFRKNPYKPIMNLVENSFTFGFLYAHRLASCEINAVKYVLEYYKFERNALEKKGGVLSGSIEKIGLFPALGALAVLAIALMNTNVTSGLVQILIPIILAFHFMNFVIFEMLQKMDRVIVMLDYDIGSRSSRGGL